MYYFGFFDFLWSKISVMKHPCHLAALATVLLLAACSGEHTVISEDPSLKFNKDGKFRIVQFTDVHFTWEKQPEFQRVMDQCADIIEKEKPDLVVFTGDVVTGGYCTFEAIDRVLSLFDGNDIPYVYLYGNHDRERQPSEWDLARAVSSRANSLNTVTDGHLDDVAVRVMSSDLSRTAAVLYCMDSGDYGTVPEYRNSPWIAHSQIDWYVDRSRAYSAANGNVPVPSYAFFHIPLHEFAGAYFNDLRSGQTLEFGEYKGVSGGYALNSGLLSAIEENADIHGVFCGHLHDSDFLSVQGGVALAFGRFSGDNTAYNHLTYGARVIELTEDDYGFHTWIRERSGDVVDDYTYEVKDDYTRRTASDIKGLSKGLVLTEYTGVNDSTYFENAVAVKTDTVACPRLYTAVEGPAGYVFEGYLRIPESGLWRLRVSGRESLNLTIDDISFPLKRVNKSTAEVNLEKGFHPIRIEVTSMKVALWSRLQWMAPGEDRLYEIPEEYFWHE